MQKIVGLRLYHQFLKRQSKLESMLYEVNLDAIRNRTKII
jgi:hypothetical protein